MTDPFLTIAVVAAFTVVLIAGAKLTAGTPAGLVGLFPPHGELERAMGVQEDDLPPFRFSASAPASSASADDAAGIPADREPRVPRIAGHAPAAG